MELRSTVGYGAKEEAAGGREIFEEDVEKKMRRNAAIKEQDWARFARSESSTS